MVAGPKKPLVYAIRWPEIARASPYTMLLGHQNPSKSVWRSLPMTAPSPRWPRMIRWNFIFGEKYLGRVWLPGLLQVDDFSGEFRLCQRETGGYTSARERQEMRAMHRTCESLRSSAPAKFGVHWPV